MAPKETDCFFNLASNALIKNALSAYVDWHLCRVVLRFMRNGMTTFDRFMI